MVSSMATEEYEDAIFDAALSTAGTRLLEVVETGNIEAVRGLVKKEQPPMFYQDPESGWSAVHVAASIESSELLSFLLEEGAVWNAVMDCKSFSVDNMGNTAGDIAISTNNQECYDVIRDAGIRSEFILRALGDHVGDAVLKTDDETAAASTDAFLASSLRYTTDENGQEVCMVDAGDGEEVGVMMGWEQPIMDETVRQLCAGHATGSEGLSILNVGFGLGMIDTLFQNLPVRPQLHVIIEAHPDVLEHMQSKGWYDKPGVVVLEGKWQDFIDSEDLSGFGGFDVIYTDTFSEEYS
ncbi:Arginine N-methyltransferase 2, partial [Tulasnella sp. 417]